MKEQDDLSIINEVLAGHTDAFEVIVKRYQDTVATIVRNMIDREDAAHDVGQEVFIRLYRSLDKFKGDSRLSTYIGRIAINLSLNELKRQKNRMHDSLDNVPDIKDNDAEMVMRDLENRQVVASALKRIGSKYRSVLVLRMIEGYSTRETAEVLGIPSGTVLSRLARAQEKMKLELQKLGYAHGEI